MREETEQRLAAAAEAVREHEVTTRRGTDLRRRIDGLTAELTVLRGDHAQEQKDVERLEGLSLTRVLVALRGARDDTLARERAEADAARYRRLLDLAEERGRLTGEVHELDEAVQAARNARTALSRVQGRLASASGWSTYDTFFGGGAVSSAVKHSRLDEAAQAAAHADRCLAVLRTELADVSAVSLTAPQLAVDGLTRFVDVWFDNVFTDLAVRDRIRQADENVARALHLVGQVQDRLRRRTAEARGRLAAIEVERQHILASP